MRADIVYSNIISGNKRQSIPQEGAMSEDRYAD